MPSHSFATPTADVVTLGGNCYPTSVGRCLLIGTSWRRHLFCVCVSVYVYPHLHGSVCVGEPGRGVRAWFYLFKRVLLQGEWRCSRNLSCFSILLPFPCTHRDGPNRFILSAILLLLHQPVLSIRDAAPPSAYSRESLGKEANRKQYFMKQKAFVASPSKKLREG